MQVEKSTVTKLYLTEITKPYHLDPITIYLEDLAPCKGKITIECYGKSWTSYWGAMGSETISQFFIEMDNHYLIKNLDPHSSSQVVDYEKIGKDLSSSKEFHLLDCDLEVYDHETFNYFLSIRGSYKALEELYGEEWQFNLPEMPNDQYEYINRIVNAVKEGLKTNQENKS